MRRVLICGLILLIMVSGLYSNAVAYDSENLTEVFVLCAPQNYVHIRRSATTKSMSIGRFETGDRIWLDGKKKNGFLHCVHLGLEMDEGWIHSGFVVYDPPEYIGRSATIVCRGRLAARKYVGGKRTRWLKSGATVKVHFWSDEWALTNCGYVRSEYLELEGI